MTDPAPHDFGLVSEHDDTFEFVIETGAAACCRLWSLEQTERGPRRRDLAEVPADLWRSIGARVARELAQGMQEGERKGTRAPTFKNGANRLSPMIGRELSVLLWVLQEEGAAAQVEPILHGWRELAREERWWLYGKAGAPGQRRGIGWRRALFHALSEAVDTRVAAPAAEKKSPAGADSRKASRPRRQPGSVPISRTPRTSQSRGDGAERRTAARTPTPS